MDHGKQQRRGRRWSREEARQELIAWWQSGMTQTAFARSRGYSVKRLWSWSGRLRAMGWEPGKEETLPLMPVRVVERMHRERAQGDAGSPDRRDGWMEVVVPNGFVVRVTATFDSRAFERVMEVVTRC